ncbi:MAG: hypothetical protein ABIP65_08205 [Vicinamibacterales bacterium]
MKTIVSVPKSVVTDDRKKATAKKKSPAKVIVDFTVGRLEPRWRTRMQTIRKSLALAAFLLLAGTVSAAPSRTVRFEVGLPGGATPQLTVVEGEAASVQIKETKYGFVPKIDSANEATVHMGIYDLSSTPHKSLGSVDLTVGGSPATSDTTPAFTLSVLEVKAKAE